MKPISGLTLALLVACGTQAAYAQTPAPQQRPAGAPAGARPGGPGMIPQQGGAQLRGAVLDAASGRPVPQASITVRSRADSAVAGGAVTRADGSFRVEGLRPGRYYLRVSHLGHAPTHPADITIAPGATSAEVPTVRLAVSAVQLEGITATAERSPV
ncbi:MAG: carboxypeptidase regulatory-like domain-containing protein, partial [Gemmatimonadetes bacterium]|nr:carboxypeptidase regulatory-like domain-containing protein [Gemmatimonadota bacterium]